MSGGTTQCEEAAERSEVPLRRAAILGAGLLGASVGLAIRQRWPSAEVRGWSRRAETREAALERGAVTSIHADLQSAAEGCQLVVVGTPIDQIAEHAIAAARVVERAGLITDVGSTKASIVAAVERDSQAADCFIGSHPLAGGERTGPAHARADLLRDRVVVLTPTARTTPQLVERAADFWQQLGARIVRLTPEEHDGALAATSHAPHVIAASLAASLPEAWLPLVASGWRDSTRIAASDPGLWRQILLDNSASVLQEIARFARVLDEFRMAIETHDGAQLESLLRNARQRRLDGDPHHR
jgi:prephenate dehydrogenase